ncbi:MAG: carbohydrate binding family 9 domain-containing protein [Bacteroidales bacterium]|nr:MAG: carbohydrate binding family 9 domain-containing protein [Bacteroidales bacterium]
MKQAFSIFLLLFLTGSIPLFGQNAPLNRNKYRLHVYETDDTITIDGNLDERVWGMADRADHFYRILPIDTGYALAQTEVMMTHDERNFYMAVICHDTLSGKRPAESLRRDFNFGRNDNFIAFIDTYNDQTNGFSFGVSAAGAQWDGLQANGGFVSLHWDCKWESAVKNFPGYWTAEFRIPFRSIRYREGDKEWGINFSRLDLKSNEKSSWAPVPRQFQSANLAYTGTLVWDKPPPESGLRFSLIPYVSGMTTRDLEADENTKFSADAGIDAKVIVSTSMNLDITLNPDFSQVEVDRQRTNLDRFELFFPEKRQFFLENSDLFANLGSEDIRPFFSRRIGLDSPVHGGLRLSGTLGNDWRIGLMNIQTGIKDSIPANNFSVAVIRRRIFSRSNIGVFMTNKQVVTSRDDSTLTWNRFNRVAGLDFNLASADNRWTGKVFYHQAFYPDNPDKAFALTGTLAYNTQQFSVSWDQFRVGENYLADMGFIRRKGFHQTNPAVRYKFYPLTKRVANHGPGLEVNLIYDPDFSLTDREIQFTYSLEWQDRSVIRLELVDGYVKLLEPFDPTHTGGDTLAAGTKYRSKEIALSYTSAPRNLFNFSVSTRYGGFFNGTRLNLNGALNYRVQPYGSIAVNAAYNRVMLPEPYKSAELILVGPRLDLTFTEKLFLTTFIQYNNQIDNLNVNIRFQWRFAPVSDLFIVYTANSWPDNFQTKNRALVVKCSYWFN